VTSDDPGVTRAESCVIACADVWREAGEVMVSPFGTIPALGARLAKRTFSPDIVLTDGEAALMVGAPPISTRPADLVREAAMPYRTVFDVVWSGRRNMMMMASQIDRTGNQNISAIGPHAKPKVQLVGVRGAPGNSVNHPTSYWVPDHTVRTFVEQVDVVSGVGYARAAAAGAGATRFHDIPRVVSNLGVFDFETPDHTMRLRSHHPGVTVDDIMAATGFALTVPDDVAETRLPTPEELELIRVETRARRATARCGAERRRRRRQGGRHGGRPSVASGAPHRAVRAHRRALPAGADGNGLGGRAPPRRRHHRGGRPRHPGLGHHEPGRAGGGHRRGAPAHHRPLRRQPAHRRGRRARAH
jgi:acyl CoA:acetate/3-ketoacid CoA transferase beta subunit